MSYTLAMATDQEPELADDGIQEVPLTIARPLLTRLIEQLREDGLVSALTVRGRRRVYLVTPVSFGDSTVFRELCGYLEELESSAAPDAKSRARVIREALDVAKRRVYDSS